MERLIGNERAQRIEEDALLVLLERQFDREEVEDERFAPPRSHDREHRLPCIEQLERLGLRFMKRRCSNKSRSELAAQSLRFFLREHLPLFAVALNESVRRFFLRPKRSRGTRIAIRIAQLVKKGGGRLIAAWAVRSIERCDMVHHRFDASVVLPRIDLQTEHRIERAFAPEHLRDVGSAEHDSRNAIDPIGEPC